VACLGVADTLRLADAGLCYLSLARIVLRDGVSEPLGGILAVVILLLMSAAADCWDLLEAIDNQSTQRFKA
jgi:hypothetical protein